MVRRHVQAETYKSRDEKATMKVVHCLMLMCLIIISMPIGCQSLSATPAPTHQHHGSNNDAIQCEVIGSSGRIGSQFMRLLGSQALAVPRGVCPGSTTTSSTTSGNGSSFILVCTPTSAWNSIYQQTLPERRCDLVFCGGVQRVCQHFCPPQWGSSLASQKPARLN